MLKVRPRGRSYQVDFWTNDARLRGSLGTRNRDAAIRLGHRLEAAICEGEDSNLWTELKKVLPHSTYTLFAKLIGVREKRVPMWDDLRQVFLAHLNQRIAIEKLSQSTADRYAITINEFDSFLKEQNIILLSEIEKPLIESFKVWRLKRINTRKHSKNGAGLVLDVAILHRVFAIAVDREMVPKNPVKMEGRPGDSAQTGAQPFSGGDLLKLRQYAGEDLLALLLLRWSGFRGVDAVKLTWDEVHFDRKEIERLTQKRKKRVILPIHSELMFLLDAERQRKKPRPTDRVLINPVTGKALTRPRLYQRMTALGSRAGVSHAHPHRFRDSFAIDLLLRGASPYDVAKMLGDTIGTVERHYMPFVRELRERVRSILETGLGLEEVAQIPPEASQNESKKPN
jgi:site-specific recombinase XerD